jgi:hypothetical protein
MTETPEIDKIPMWEQVRRFDEDAYFFPISGVKPYVHDVIANAADETITRPLVLGKHMDLYGKSFQEKQVFPLAGKAILGVLAYRQGEEETLEGTFKRIVTDIDNEIQKSAFDSGTDMGALEFAYRFGEAVAFMHLTNKPYDTEHTYFPSEEELNSLPFDQQQLSYFSGLLTAWEVRRAINKDHSPKNPFIGLVEMREWGAHNFRFVDNDFYYDIQGPKKAPRPRRSRHGAPQGRNRVTAY